jgi:putative FmdB family regulatory protein
LYEYVCQACGLSFERLVRGFAESVACPACQALEVEKQLSAFAMAGSSGERGPGSGCGCGRGGCGCR